MGKTFLWRKSTKVKCHMSGEGISNLIHNRQKECRRVSWPSGTCGVNTQRNPRPPPRTAALSRCPLPLPGSACCEMLASAALKGHQIICFHPLHKPLFSRIPCEIEYVITSPQCYRRGSSSSVFVGTELVFTPLCVNVSHFKLLFLLDTLVFFFFFSPNCTYPKPTRL